MKESFSLSLSHTHTHTQTQALTSADAHAHSLPFLSSQSLASVPTFPAVSVLLALDTHTIPLHKAPTRTHTLSRTLAHSYGAFWWLSFHALTPSGTRALALSCSHPRTPSLALAFSP